jgi:hypothetical protein
MILGASGDNTSISYLEVLLRDPNPEVVQEASRAIRLIRSRSIRAYGLTSKRQGA